MKEIRFVADSALNFIVIEPFRRLQRSNSDVANFLYAFIGYTTFLLALYSLIWCAFFLKDKIITPSADLASQQVRYDWRWGDRHQSYVPVEYSDIHKLDQKYVCKAPIVKIDAPGSHQCVGEDGIRKINLQAQPGRKLWCCPEAQERRLAPVLFPQRFEDLGIVYYSAFVSLPVLGIIFSGIYLAKYGISFFNLLLNCIDQLAFSVLRGVRNTFHTMTLPQLVKYNFPKLSESIPFIVQLSDLHLTKGNNQLYELKHRPYKWQGEPTEVEGESLASRTSAALLAAASVSPSAIIITGDITDTGEEDEWKSFLGVISSISYCLSEANLILMSGNHDINFNTPDRPDPELKEMQRREMLFSRYCEKISQIDGIKLRREVIIPLNVLHHLHQKINLLVINTNNYQSHHSNSGAIGLIGAEQYRNISAAISTATGPLIVAMHHHFGIPSGHKQNFEERYLFTIDARKLLLLLDQYSKRSPGNSVLVIHGHRHMVFESTVLSGNVKVFGLSSSTLGTEVTGLVPENESAYALDGRATIAEIGMNAAGDWAINVKRMP